MSGDAPDKHIVRGFLLMGHHDALIDLFGQHQRKMGNHLVLSISEACIEHWPVTLADYTPPHSNTAERVNVRITVRADLYPRLYARVKSLGSGVRTTVFLNMLNRHAELSCGAPQEVEKAMKELDAARRVQHTHASQSVDQSSHDAERSTPQTWITNKGTASEVSQVTQKITTAEIAEPVMEVDPLSMVHCGL